MNSFFILLLGLIAIYYLLYVSLINKKNKLKEALAGVDVQLKKRYDLIPNLLTTAAKFMEHETALLEEITSLRTEAMTGSFAKNPEQVAKIENKLTEKLREFNISVENYPDLKSNQTMVQAMQAMEEVEENIAAARRFYNSAVNDLNNAVEIFPSSIIARQLHIKQSAYFVAPENEKKSVNAGEFFK